MKQKFKHSAQCLSWNNHGINFAIFITQGDMLFVNERKKKFLESTLDGPGISGSIYHSLAANIS